MTRKQALQHGREVLQGAQIDDADLDAWYLLAHVCKISRSDYYLDTEKELSSEQEEVYKDMLHKRSERVPLQHILEQQEFMGLSFYVNEHVLIPRQDTECLVEEVQKIVKPEMEILDMCTGSGCILISLLKGMTELKGAGVDISPDALEVARKNAADHEVKAAFLQSDLFERVQGSYDVIISNPPYIPSGEIPHLMEEVREHEPMQALDGREDGLYFYEQITEQACAYLKEGGRLYFEIGWDQREAVMELLQRHGYSEIHAKQDLAGCDRIVYGVYRKQEIKEEAHV